MRGHGNKARIKPVGSTTPRIKPTQSCVDAFSAICRSATDQILKNWAVVQESDYPEGPHQMRVGLRRLRSAFRAFRPMVDDEFIRDLNRASRELGLVLSELRDADVLVTEIVAAVVAEHPDNPDLAPLITALATVQILKSPASDANHSHRKQASSAETGSCTAMSSFTRNWGATICARAAQGFGFKRCCMGSGRYDGTLRNHFFQAQRLTT